MCENFRKCRPTILISFANSSRVIEIRDHGSKNSCKGLTDIQLESRYKKFGQVTFNRILKKKLFSHIYAKYVHYNETRYFLHLTRPDSNGCQGSSFPQFINNERELSSAELCMHVGEGTLPWAIIRFRIFSNYFSQKFEKIKITMYGNFCLNVNVKCQTNLTFGPRQGPRPLNLYKN